MAKEPVGPFLASAMLRVRAHKVSGQPTLCDITHLLYRYRVYRQALGNLIL
jgi:hypothetical protein